MSLQQISSGDIATWDSLTDVAEILEKRGVQSEPSLGEDHEVVLRLTDDDEFMVLINAPPGETADSFKSRTNINTHTGLVATDDFEEFTFITRVRSWDAHGRTKHQQVSFTKEQMTSETGEKNTIVDEIIVISFGLIGYLIIKHNYSVITLILGLILGPIIESNVHRSIQLGDPSIFVAEPLRVALILSILLSLLAAVMSMIKN